MVGNSKPTDRARYAKESSGNNACKMREDMIDCEA